jgi:hypothetical protein
MTGTASSPAGKGQLIALITSGSCPESIRQTLQDAFRSEFVTYSTPSEIEGTQGNNPLPKLILLWVDSQVTTVEDLMTALSEFASESPVVVLSGQDDADLAHKALSFGAKGYLPLESAGDLAVIVTRFILTSGTDTAKLEVEYGAVQTQKPREQNIAGRYRPLNMMSTIAPPPPKRINDPEHWRSRAEEARTIAEQMGDREAIATMLHVAEQYEDLAHKAERRRLA